MGLIPQDAINQVLDRCDIVEVISGYIPLKKSGRNFKALSPFTHEKTPSFFVSPDKQIYHCFSTGKGGNVISFVMEQERLTFPEAVRLLAEKVGVAIQEEKVSSERIQLRNRLFEVNELAQKFFHRILLTDRGRDAGAAREYLKKRGLNLEAVKKFQLGFVPDRWDALLSFFRTKKISTELMQKAGLIVPRKSGDGFYDRFRNRIIFPIFDYRSRSVAFGARTMKKDDPVKYINSPETPLYVKGTHLYGLQLAKTEITRRDEVIIVEGYMDFIMPFLHGVENIVASLGTALTPDQIRLIKRYTKNVVMLYDADQAGTSAIIRSLDLLIEEGCHVKIATLTAGEDPDSYIRKHGREGFEKRLQASETIFDFKFGALARQFDARSVEGKADIIAEMLPTINRFGNEVMRSEYRRRLAQILKVDEEALIAEIKKSKPGYRKTTPTSPEGLRKTAVSPAEKTLLRLFLESPEYIEKASEELEISDFQNEQTQGIVRHLFAVIKTGTVSAETVSRYFTDEKDLNLVSELLAAEELTAKDRERIWQGCLQRIRERRQKFRSQQISQAIAEAQTAGDQKKLEELTRQFNELPKR